jgi:hypothetical protein
MLWTCAVTFASEPRDGLRVTMRTRHRRSHHMATREFPRIGFLILGVLSIAACLIFVVRSVGVEATVERVWSAVAFGAMGTLLLWAYWSSRHD